MRENKLLRREKAIVYDEGLVFTNWACAGKYLLILIQKTQLESVARNKLLESTGMR